MSRGSAGARGGVPPRRRAARRQGPVQPDGGVGQFPEELARLLPADTVSTWSELGGLLPGDVYLVGEAAVATHLQHRLSRDLDFFFHDNRVDLAELARQLEATGKFASTSESAGTLQGVFNSTKVEFFHADEHRPQHRLEDPVFVAGIRVAGLRDLVAMKLKVISDRGELRDYFDLKAIDEDGRVSIEDGILDLLERYGLRLRDNTVVAIVKALGYLDDVEEDAEVPMPKEELAAWWSARQARLITNLAMWGV